MASKDVTLSRLKFSLNHKELLNKDGNQCICLISNQFIGTTHGLGLSMSLFLILQNITTMATIIFICNGCKYTIYVWSIFININNKFNNDRDGR